MNDRDQRRYERALRVRIFGQTNASDFAPNSKATEHFTTLNNLIGKLDEAKADQKPNRVTKETLVDALVLDLKNIARTAREIDKKQPGFAAPYRIPDNPAESAITTHADSLLARLEDEADDPAAVKPAKAALRARFIAYEMAADFVADLRADREAIAEANQTNEAETRDCVENTALIGQLLGEINEVVSGLDAVMYNKYTRQPEKLRAWQTASHVERAPQREKKAAAAPAPVPA